jgi:predicted amidophosphoribosyltransferase
MGAKRKYRTRTCPACGHNFVQIRNSVCPKCKVGLYRGSVFGSDGFWWHPGQNEWLRAGVVSDLLRRGDLF